MTDPHALHWHMNLKGQQFDQRYPDCRLLFDVDDELLNMCELKKRRGKKKQKHARQIVATPRRSQAPLLLLLCLVVEVRKRQGLGWQLRARLFAVRPQCSQAGLVL